MKPILRILVILLSIIIVGVALRPPSKTSSEPEPDPSPTTDTPAPVEETPQSQRFIKDLLGGAAIEKGKDAKEKISELNLQREKEFEENGL